MARLQQANTFFGENTLSGILSKENNSRWTDKDLGKMSDYACCKLNNVDLAPYVALYIKAISGGFDSTLPLGKLMTVLIDNVRKPDLVNSVFQSMAESKDGDITGIIPSVDFSQMTEEAGDPQSTLEGTGLGAHEMSFTDEEQQKKGQELLALLSNAKTQEQVCSLVCFHALVSFRMCIKSNESVRKYLDGQFTHVCKSVYPRITINPVLPPANERFLDQIKANMDKGSDTCTGLFRKILVTYVSATHDKHKDITSILEAGILRHTQGNGLGLVNMLLNASQLFGMPAGHLTQLMASDQTIDTLELLKDFAEHYLIEKSGCVSWWWCRIIDDTQWTSLRVSRNPSVAMKLAYLLYEKNIGILDSNEIMEIQDSYKVTARAWATAFRKFQSAKLNAETGIGESNKILEMARKIAQHDNPATSIPSAQDFLAEFGDDLDE